jgi:hypothetical protein
VIVVLAVFLAGCGGSSSTTTNSAASQLSTTSSAATNAGSSAASEGLTAYGATDAAWDANHQADTRFAPGTSYNPDPSLARGDVQHDARYYGVVHQGGRVLQYQMRFAPGTTVDQARQSVIASEFPPGTTTLQFQTLDTCAILNVQSSELAGITPNGGASVEFVSGAAGDTYDPTDVWGAIVSFGALSQC